MLRNYFIIAFRHLRKQQYYSLINILGLALGLACLLFIGLYLRSELSYDRYHPRYADIYRMNFDGKLQGADIDVAAVSSPAASTVMGLKEVEESFRFHGTGNWFIQPLKGGETHKEENVVCADPNFFQFWQYPLIYGVPDTCLSSPNTLVMDESTSKKYFGNANPVGKKVMLDNKLEYVVTGVYPDFPPNTHFHFNVMLTNRQVKDADSEVWLRFTQNTYFKLKSGVIPAVVEDQFQSLVKAKFTPEIRLYFNQSWDEFHADGNYLNFSLTPVSKIHLHSSRRGELEANGSIGHLYLVGLLGIMVLILACINFINLSTAKSANRAKEVGMRKAIGAVRVQLIMQFLCEAMVVTFLAGLIAVTLVHLSIPLYNRFTGSDFSTSDLMMPDFLVALGLVIVLTGLVAGSYPAFYLSRFRPVHTLKGKLLSGSESKGIRHTLVIVQFTISMAMVTASLVVLGQLSYIQNKPLGFDKDKLLLVQDAWILRDSVHAFRDDVLKGERVNAATVSGFMPGASMKGKRLFFADSAGGGKSLLLNGQEVDRSFIPTMGITIQSGRNFDDRISDSMSVVINESAARILGNNDPVGSWISTPASYFFDGAGPYHSYQVIGVMKDFHFNSMKVGIEPLLLFFNNKPGYVTFKVAGEACDETIRYVAGVWEKYLPGQPFTYNWMDEALDDLYQSEVEVGRLLIAFSSLAVFIACLGLFGMASFTAEQKRKEVGVRKVLGASILQIIHQLSVGIIRPISMAFFIAAPITYFSMREWLDDFAYHTNMQVWVFVAVGVGVGLVAWLTMGLQSWRAAKDNPAKALRTE